MLSAAAVTVNEAALLRPVRGRIMGGARVNEAASALADVAVTAALAARCRASHAEAEPTVARGGGAVVGAGTPYGHTSWIFFANLFENPIAKCY